MVEKASSKRPRRASGSTAARLSASGSKDESRSSQDAEVAPEQVNDAELQQVCCRSLEPRSARFAGVSDGSPSACPRNKGAS
eukprot:6916156-Prymnesium_polylepis.1